MPWMRHAPTRPNVRCVRLRDAKRGGYRRDRDSRRVWLNFLSICFLGEPVRIVGWLPSFSFSDMPSLGCGSQCFRLWAVRCYLSQLCRFDEVGPGHGNGTGGAVLCPGLRSSPHVRQMRGARGSGSAAGCADQNECPRRMATELGRTSFHSAQVFLAGLTVGWHNACCRPRGLYFALRFARTLTRTSHQEVGKRGASANSVMAHDQQLGVTFPHRFSIELQRSLVEPPGSWFLVVVKAQPNVSELTNVCIVLTPPEIDDVGYTEGS